jgi:hypothetical protein
LVELNCNDVPLAERDEGKKLGGKVLESIAVSKRTKTINK